ncbi:MAG: rod shape-determining protein, partial [Candidatus Niyogibacteria bacterium]|nr:rod shape-determining protein [Candidatus Niyogibacteria bacterium]
MAFFVKKLGIDLGTANTLVFVPGSGIVLNEPSVVAVSVPENRVLAVGNEAKVMVGKTPDNIMAYRPMKDGVIADYRITEAMLRYYIGKSLGKWNLFKPEVLVSVPAGVTSTERRSVVEAALKAGARQSFVMKEPILAAIGAGIPIHEPTGHMVVDIGGGTADIAVISLGGIVASTSVKVAGNKIDQAIADYIKKNFNLAIGDRTAEEIKIAIGSAIPLDEEKTYLIKGRDFLTGLPRSTEVSTNEVAKAVENELKEITKAIKSVLHETPPELAADIIDQGIIMTGGTSLLSNITELVYRATGVKAYVAEDALFCVAKG